MENDIEEVVKEIWLKEVYWIILLWIQEIDFSILHSQFQIMEK